MNFIKNCLDKLEVCFKSNINNPSVDTASVKKFEDALVKLTELKNILFGA